MSASQETSALIPVDINTLLPTLDAVRTNCHISDALHATDYTLCIYLLKMREYFRWERNIPFNEPLSQKDLTAWVTQRETRWESMKDKAFEKIPIMDTPHNPFAAETINNALNNLGYVYSSGYGRNMKPLFFLGTLENRTHHNDYTVIVSGKEYARDLVSPPAMSLGNTIYIRRESLRRMLWERIEEWRWNRPQNAMQSALDCYDFEHAAEQSLDAMTDTELETVILHEIGEVRAGMLLGGEWEAMLASLPHSKAELMIRAVRDNLADALSTLPGLLANANRASLHFYIANMTNMRKTLFPKLISAYQAWTLSGSTVELEQLVSQAEVHWQSLAERLLEIFSRQGNECPATVISTIESHTL